jgi:hypothetical protein
VPAPGQVVGEGVGERGEDGAGEPGDEGEGGQGGDVARPVVAGKGGERVGSDDLSVHLMSVEPRPYPIPLENWARTLTCRFRQSEPGHFVGTQSAHPLPAECPSSVPTGLEPAKITAARLRASAAAKQTSSPTDPPEPKPCTADDANRAFDRTSVHAQKNRRSQPRSLMRAPTAPARSRERREHAQAALRYSLISPVTVLLRWIRASCRSPRWGRAMAGGGIGPGVDGARCSCAMRRLVVSPTQLGGTRREVPGPDG